MIRNAATVATIALMIASLAVPSAEARRRSRSNADAPAADDSGGKAGKAKNAKEASNKPVQLASFGDWNAYLAKGRSKTCYTLASPKTRKPDVQREAAYVFIADRPAEKVHNEVSIIMGFPLKDSGPLEAKVGSASFDLVAKGSNAWIKNTKDEARFVEALKHSGKLIVRAAAIRGPATVDTYALSGLRQALDRVGKECK